MILKRFENFNNKITIDEVKDFFMEMIDELSDVQYREGVEPTEVKFRPSRSESVNSVYVEVTFDLYQQVWIENQIKEIASRLKNTGDYEVKVFKKKQTGRWNFKDIPVHGRDYTTTVRDPVMLIKMVVKKI